jgi:hypothetical protein
MVSGCSSVPIEAEQAGYGEYRKLVESQSSSAKDQSFISGCHRMASGFTPSGGTREKETFGSYLSKMALNVH